MNEILEPLLTIAGAGLLVVVSFTKLASETTNLRRELNDVKKELDESVDRISDNFISSVKVENSTQLNAQKIQEAEKKIESLFELLNQTPKREMGLRKEFQEELKDLWNKNDANFLTLREKFDEYVRKNGNGNHGK
tara:strand:+ start:598 stop:1005 length:408 start_codon:yes stop_codon:yes gene_type:complete